MPSFNFNEAELLTFFAVLVRVSVLFSVMPFIGDRFVPVPVKILLSLAVTLVLVPSLIATGLVRPSDAVSWGSSASGIVSTIGLEVMFALILGYTARIAFEAVNFGGNLAGTFMGFAMASTYDHNQQSQTQVVSEIQMALAMLLFLAIDGHHLMLRSALGSYSFLGLGGSPTTGSLLAPTFGSAFGARLIELTGQVLRSGIQLAAPIAIALFGVNVAFGVMAKAMPQLNILVLSITISALIGLVIMFLSLGEFQGVVRDLFERSGENISLMARALGRGQ